MCCFFRPETAYDLRISDWSSDVCSSDLVPLSPGGATACRGCSVLRSLGPVLPAHHDGAGEDVMQAPAALVQQHHDERQPGSEADGHIEQQDDENGLPGLDRATFPVAPLEAEQDRTSLV